MAISDDLPGFEVTISVNGEALKEYTDSTLQEEERTVTRYIEAVSGREFSVSLKAKKGTHFQGTCLACSLSVDGHWIQTPLLHKSDCRKADLSETVEGSRPGAGMVRRFCFSAIETGM